jgi:uncharacterized protein (DUF1330 family)
MAAYLIVDVVRIHDPQTYERYKQQVVPSLAAAGGRYLARGGTVDVLEGDWKPSRLVVVRFDSAAEARRWWASDGYQPLRQMRQRSTDCNMLIVEGCGEPGTP